MIETKKSFCRFCHAYCAIEVDIEDNRAVAVRGDASDPIYGGYTCIKGRHLHDQHNHSDRIRSTQRRRPDGSFEAIGSEQALDEIAAKLTAIIEERGPRAVALWGGAGGALMSLSISGDWLRAIGSPSFYSGATIDQEAKPVAQSMHGKWDAGAHPFEDADTWMLIGANPVISMWGGIPHQNPWKRINDARKAGLKLIVIDPRKTECARRSDIHLQVKPGEDATLLAGIIRTIIEEGLYDADFVQANVQGFEELRETVDDFTPDYVEERTNVPAALMQEAARTFAAGQRGRVTSGTGLDMQPRGTLHEYLVLALNTITGRWLREGEEVPNPYVLLPGRTWRAQTEELEPLLPQDSALESRFRGLKHNDGQFPANVLADEILTPGPEQVRALFVMAGDPAVSVPNHDRIVEAFKNLELLVTIDWRMSATAKLSHYVIACKLSLERPDVTMLPEAVAETYGHGGYTVPYAHYTPALIEPDFDVIQEWELFWGLAHRMRTPMTFRGKPLDIDRKLTSDEMFDVMMEGSRIPFDEVKGTPGGRLYPDASIRVEAREPGKDARLNVGFGRMMEDLRDVRGEPLTGGAALEPGEEYTHRLITRRMRHVFNGMGQQIPELMEKYSYNPAFLSPFDLRALGLKAGDIVEIASKHGAIRGVVESDDTVPSGVISMAHSWGDSVEREEDTFRTWGSNTNKLVSFDEDFDPIYGMPRMTSLPVNIRKLEGVEAG